MAKKPQFPQLQKPPNDARPRFEEEQEQDDEPRVLEVPVTQERPETAPRAPETKRPFKVARKITMDERTTYRWKAQPRAIKLTFGHPVEWNTEGAKPLYLGPNGHPVRFAKRVNANVPVDMREAVEEAARLTGRSMAEIVRQALINRLAR